MEWKTGTHCCI